MKKHNVIDIPNTSTKFSTVNRTGFYLLQTYINVSFYSCFLPFRISFDKRKEEFFVGTSGTQRLICIMFHTLYILYAWLCNGHRILHHKSVMEDPSQYFTVMESFIDMLYPCFVMYTVFCKVGKIAEFLDAAQREKTLHLPVIGRVQKYLIPFAMFTVYWVFNTFVQLGETRDVHAEVAEVIDIRLIVANSSKPAGIQPDQQKQHSFAIPVEKVLSPLGIPAQLSLHLFLAYGRAVSSSIILIFFAFGIYLRDLCEELRQSIALGLRSPSAILGSYLSIKQINACIDSIFSGLFCFYVLGSLPYYARSLMKMGEQHTYFFLRIFHISTQFLLSMLGSAEANRKVSSLKDELVILKMMNKEYEKGEHTTFLTLLSELSSNTIGLRGGPFFTATYQFLGMMMAQSLVYALILLQLNYGGERMLGKT